MDKKFKVESLLGIDRSLKAAPNTTYDIKNMSYSPKMKAWFSERGWLGYTHPSPGKDTEDVYSLGLFPQRANSKTFILAEREETSGSLQLEYIAQRKTAGHVTLKTGRHKPTIEDQGTFYLQYGLFMLIMNGYNTPLKYFGDGKIEEFGFHKKPSAPQPFRPMSGNMEGSAGEYYYAKTVDGDDITVALPKVNYIGLGVTASSELCSYSYKVSFISDTGSESPLSNASQVVTWGNGYKTVVDGEVTDEQNYRYGIVVDKIPVGPEGTIKRRLYRTKNLLNGNADIRVATYYFLDDIPNNVEEAYMDVSPDSELASIAPTEIASGLFPMGVKYCATLNGRVFVAGGTYHPTAIFFSAASQPETFPVYNYLDGVARDGGDITGLYAYNSMLYVFRKKAIEVIIPTDDSTEPFKIVTVTNSIGTTATKTIQAIPGSDVSGLIFLAEDGFYLIQGNYLGGDKIQIVKISDGLSEYVDRINTTALARAVATYNAADDEYWCSVPTDGYSFPTLSLVLHPNAPGWSVRERVPANCFIQLPEGYTMFGTNANIATTEITAAGGTIPLGIPISYCVWCGIKGYGYSVASEAGKSSSVAEPILSSQWLDFGDPEKEKDIKYVTVYTLSNTAGPSLAGIVAKIYTDDVNIAQQKNIYNIGTMVPDRKPQTSYNSTTKLIGETETVFEKYRVSEMRYSFEVPSFRKLRVEFSTETRAFNMYIIGYSITYSMNGVEHAGETGKDIWNVEEPWTGFGKALGDNNTENQEIQVEANLPSTILW